MANDYEARKRAKKRKSSDISPELASEGGKKNRKKRAAVRRICKGMCYNPPGCKCFCTKQAQFLFVLASSHLLACLSFLGCDLFDSIAVTEEDKAWEPSVTNMGDEESNRERKAAQAAITELNLARQAEMVSSFPHKWLSRFLQGMALFGTDLLYHQFKKSRQSDLQQIAPFHRTYWDVIVNAWTFKSLFVTIS